MVDRVGGLEFGPWKCLDLSIVALDKMDMAARLNDT